MTFDRSDPNAIVIMYPTGGYGNFLYMLLSNYLENTVKLQSHFEFSKTGNSHKVLKHVEPFLLGHQKSALHYTYEVYPEAEEQIKQGKKFLVLGDMGNRGDNIKFLKRYFTNATVIRVYAESFDEKLIVWANCMFKAYRSDVDPTYPGALITHKGIQSWAGRESITDQDAVDCMANFFLKNFEPYGQYFNQPRDDVINVAIREFLSEDSIVDMVQRIANELATQLVNELDLRAIAKQFISVQQSFMLLSDSVSHFPLIERALDAYKK
jgi:hypothetical protein